MAKKDLVRFSMSVDWELLKEFDAVIQQEGYENRSFAIRALFREFILSTKLKQQNDVEGLFVILAVFKSGFCNLCGSAFYINIPFGGDKNLCICVVEDKKEYAMEKFKKFNSSLDVEYCKLITMEVKKDD